MIILEGPNGTGKSTIAKILCDNLQLEYYKVKMTREKAKYLNYKWYVEETQKLLPTYLVDRWHLGQIIYPQVFKDGRKPLTIGQQHLLERMLMIRGAILIRCTASRKFIEHVYNTRGETEQTITESKLECQLFNQVHRQSIMPKFIYSPEFTKKQRKQFFKDVKNAHSWMMEATHNLRRFCGTGYPSRPVMLIGECFNPTEKLQNHAFSSFKGSSEFLHRALSFTKEPQRFYITNAYKTRDEAINFWVLFKEITLLQPTQIIALGQRASRLLKKMYMTHAIVPHPQSIKRFQNSQIYNYAKLIDKMSRRK